MRVFLDTSVILDLLDDQRPFHASSRALIATLIDEGHTIIIAEDMLTTIYCIARNKQVVLEFFESITQEWVVAPFGLPLIHDAITICKSNPQLDFEDTLQALLAKSQGCSILYTNDSGFQAEGITIKFTTS